MQAPGGTVFFPVDAGRDDKERERAAHKLELCPKEYLPVIEAAIDAAINLNETGKA